MRSVASTLMDSGDHDAALPLNTELVATNRRVHGAEHEDTLSVMTDLAATHQRIGNHHLVLLLFQEVLNARRRTLGDGHAGRQTLTMDAEWSCCARASVTRGDLLLEVHRSVGAYELQGPHVLLFERAVCPVWLWSL